MDKLFKKLGARVTQVEVEYSRKMADGNYGSVGGMFRVTAEVAQGKNPDEAIDGLFAWIKEAAVRNMKPSFKEVVKTVAQPTQLHVPDKEDVSKQEFLKEPVNIPVDEDGNEICLINVESIEVAYNLNKEKIGKVRGKTKDYPSDVFPYKGNYTMHGVPAYKNVLATIDFDVDNRDLATYKMQPGYTAQVQIVDDKPKKIIAFV